MSESIEIVAHKGKLTTTEQQAFEDCERTIEAGIESFIVVGAALLKISEDRLYRVTHSDFETYCRERWNMSARRAYQLCAAANVMENIKGAVSVNNCSELPTHESQLRPLAKLPPEEQPQAWKKAVKDSGGKPTAKDVVKAAGRAAVGGDEPHITSGTPDMLDAGKPKKGELIDDDDPGGTPQPSSAKQIASLAIEQLKAIGRDDEERTAALEDVVKWIDKRLGRYHVAPRSRREQFGAALGLVANAKSEMEGLRDGLQNWLDGIPDNLQGGTKAEELGTAIEGLDEVIGQLEEAEGASVEFPAMR